MPVKSPRRRRRRRARSPLSTSHVVLALLIVAAAVILSFKVFAGSDPDADTSADSNAAAEDSSAVAVETETTEPELGIIVCLDPGHGGEDPGCSYDDNVEATQVLELALAVRDAMEEAGITVVMTREDDTYVGLEERAAIANAANADYFISFHRNTYEGGQVNGVEVHYAPNSSDETIYFAEMTESKLVEAGISRDRGTYETNLAVCRLSEMPAILVEMGYVIDEEDNQLFYENMQAYAVAFTEAVLESYEAYHSDTDSESEANEADDPDSEAVETETEDVEAYDSAE